MFARIKKSGQYQYLQIVENSKIDGKVRQRVISTVGRLDQLQAKGSIETLIRSLARFSEKTLLVLSGKVDVNAHAVKIGPALIFERLWRELGLPVIFRDLLTDRKFEFDIERAVFLTVLHRLFVSGSDRSCNGWRRDYAITGVDGIALHHCYRAMAFIGEVLTDQADATPFAPRCMKDLVEERLFGQHRQLFTGLDLVFFDTTSIYFEREGGTTLDQFGHSKDHRSDRKQMVVGAILDDNGRPICCEMWPGNTADVKSLLPVVERLRKRFGIKRFCIVADRGMISADTIATLETPDCNIPYILGARMRRVKEVSEEVLSRGGRYHEVHPEGVSSKSPAPLAVKEIDEEARFDGKWVLRTNMNLSAEQVALKYKELWQVEQVFRDVKSILDTRPVFHKRDETIRGHVFCSFLALVLRKELDRRLESCGHQLEWADIKRDLKALQDVVVEDNGRSLVVRTACAGSCGKVFQAVGVALPPTIREI